MQSMNEIKWDEINCFFSIDLHHRQVLRTTLLTLQSVTRKRTTPKMEPILVWHQRPKLEEDGGNGQGGALCIKNYSLDYRKRAPHCTQHWWGRGKRGRGFKSQTYFNLIVENCLNYKSSTPDSQTTVRHVFLLLGQTGLSCFHMSLTDYLTGIEAWF